jgi:predicted transcriptional regulator
VEASPARSRRVRDPLSAAGVTPAANARRHRARLCALLADTPGLTTGEAARALGVDRTTATYHLRRLAKARAAVAEGARWFPVGALDPRERPVVVAARNGRALLDAVRATPGASKSALARVLGLPRATLAWKLARLERAGLVRCQRRGREVLVLPAT